MNLTKNTAMRLAFPLATYDIGSEQPSGSFLLEDFLARCRAMHRPRVLELGTKRAEPDQSTRRDAWVPNAIEYLGADLQEGTDVDIVVDVHRLTKVVGEEQFDVIIACAIFEHLKYPHLAAHQIMKALKLGGALFIWTHQTFPLHAYPYDYFRFSREALAGLFGSQMGFRVISTDYEYPARVYAPHDPNARNGPAYLGVRLYGEKIGPTPQAYVYEFDS